MTYIIAEVGLAHEGDVGKARALIDLARCADAVKFQVYRTEDLIDRDRDPVRYDRFKSVELSYDDFEGLRDYAGDLEWFATPHTVGAVHFLQNPRPSRADRRKNSKKSQNRACQVGSEA